MDRLTINIKKKLTGFQGEFNLDINENLPKGSFIGIFGSSGSGKSTFLDILSGLLAPDEGYISCDSEIWFSKNKKLTTSQRKIGYVFQENVLLDHFTVYENLKFALTHKNQTKFLEKLINDFDLKNLLQLNPNQLSGGQKQLVCLIRAIVRKPKILLLDEPLSSVDYELRKELQNLILKIHNDLKLTCIMVSHDPNELKYMTDHIWKMKAGKIIEKGDANHMLGEFI